MDRSAVEDEKHILLECPEYAVEREGLWALGISPSSEMAGPQLRGAIGSHRLNLAVSRLHRRVAPDNNCYAGG